MKIKFDIKKHLMKNYLIYIAGLIAVPTVTSYLISFKNQAKDYEKFTIVSSLEMKKTSTLYDKLKSYQELKEPTIFARAYDDKFFTYAESHLISADIIILPNVENAISENALNTYLSFSSSDTFYNDNNYIYNDTHYGLLLNKEKLDSEFEFKDSINYYAFVRKGSLHIKHWNNNSKTDIVYSLLNDYLL